MPVEQSETLRDLLLTIERHPGVKILAQYFLEYIEKLKTKQLSLDPYTQADEIKSIQIEIEVMTIKIAKPFDFYLNHKDLFTTEKFSIVAWFKGLFRNT